MNDNVLPEPLKFDWDKGNIDKSLEKHEIKNDEAEQVFVNDPLISEDVKHSTKTEKRYQSLGVSDNKKLLFVSFTIRNKKVRIISVRLMSKKERKIYEKTE